MSNSRPGFSRRNDSQDEEDDSEDEVSKSILERLYGQLEGAIAIEGSTTSLPSFSSNSKQLKEDSDKSEAEEEEQQQHDQDEDEAMEFRLFASDDTPTAIVLNSKDPEILYVHRERPPLDESPNSERMRQIAQAAIDAKTIIEQSHIPWARSFFEHKVIHIPFEQKAKTTKVRKSRRKREWEKKVKAGLIDQATINATARKTKVSESWGQAYIIRHGLDRNTIASVAPSKGNHDSKRGRGGGRGGARSSRGSSHSRGRGGVTSSGTTRGEYTEKLDRHSNNNNNRGNNNKSIDRSAKAGTTIEPSIKVLQEDERKEKIISKVESATTIVKKPMPVLSDKRTVDPIHPKAENNITDSSPPRPHKKPKINKPVSKLDNIMAILTGGK
ncbi:hypothetical protein FBU30_009981 [Linnemannia zychae]|nr:hypothetical protein FBU30_009981 [Linnemannia zychae]